MRHSAHQNKEGFLLSCKFLKVMTRTRRLIWLVYRAADSIAFINSKGVMGSVGEVDWMMGN